MSLAARFGLGIPAAMVAGIVGGPALAYVAWKGVGFAATGNPLHLIPGGSAFSDGAAVLSEVAAFSADATDLAAVAADASDIGSDSSMDLADRNVWDQPTDQDVWQHQPSDVHGNPLGRDHLGQMPSDIHGKQL